MISLGSGLARNGCAAVAVSQPSFGKSQGKADYVGPLTLKVLTEGYRKFKKESYVDADRMGIYGFDEVKIPGIRENMEKETGMTRRS